MVRIGLHYSDKALTTGYKIPPPRMKRRRKLEGSGNNRNLQEGGKIYRYIPNRVFIRATIRSVYNRWQCDELYDCFSNRVIDCISSVSCSIHTFLSTMNICFNTHFQDTIIYASLHIFEVCGCKVTTFF